MSEKENNYRALTLSQVRESLLSPAPTLILMHARPDADAVGSAFALALWLREHGSPAYCVCADEIPARLRFLVRGLQESVFPETVPQELAGARAVSVDVASPSQLGALKEEYLPRISLMIDHHGSGEPFADYLLDPAAAATGELILDLVAQQEKPLPARMAELLYAAISGDTGCFRYSNTTGKTHRRAATLVETGIDTAEINRRLFEEKSLPLLRAERAGFDRLHLYQEGRIAILTFPYALRVELGLANEDLETLIDVARCVAGVEIAASIRQPEQGDTYRVSMRSSVDFDVSAVCARFGGGGHARAAGATLHAASIEEAEESVLQALLSASGA